ncbi:MAG: tRNA(Leu) C34 or U34 (ribose-2'-O)-methylase TrmL [Candidatus Azotimanducaceae bacterium]|jgi:tRNA(Leu) C34 or U34 (ribose-2'-O)-methylase TrmL
MGEDLLVAKQMTESNLSIGLSNPKNPINVGLVMRAAGCFEVDSVFYTGERYDRAASFNTDTQNSSLSIPLTWVPSLPGNIADNTHVVCVELVEGATPLPAYQHPNKALYIFGPEDGTIQQEVLDRADSVVFMPTIGSLNLAAAVNVLLYDRLSKMPVNDCYEALIRESRDTNNQTKVKNR